MATILVVDDAQTDRQLMGKIVAACGHKVEYAFDGEEALTKAKGLSPAMVLLDVVMPKLDGFGVCRRLRKDPVTATIKIVLVTSKGSDSDRFWGRQQGADDHLVKPFTPEQIRQVIGRMIPGGAK